MTNVAIRSIVLLSCPKAFSHFYKLPNMVFVRKDVFRLYLFILHICRLDNTSSFTTFSFHDFDWRLHFCPRYIHLCFICVIVWDHYHLHTVFVEPKTHIDAIMVLCKKKEKGKREFSISICVVQLYYWSIKRNIY